MQDLTSLDEDDHEIRGRSAQTAQEEPVNDLKAVRTTGIKDIIHSTQHAVIG